MSKRLAKRLEEDEKLLYFAISDDKPEQLKSLLTRGVSIDSTFDGSNQWGKSALHLCCEKGHYECARILVETGAKIDQQDDWYHTPLMYSVFTERPEMVELLVQAGCDLDVQDRYGKTALHFAVTKTNSDCLKMLIDGGSNIDCYDETGKTALWLAAVEDGHSEALQCLIKGGSDINHQDMREKRTPLQTALVHTTTDTLPYVRLLLDNGADVNTTDFYGSSPMVNIIRKGEHSKTTICSDHLEIAKLLIKAGYDVNFMMKADRSFQFHGTALKAAAARGASSYVELLLGAGANPDLHDMNFATPLLHAIRNKHIDVVKLLLIANCNMNIIGLARIGTMPVLVTPFLCSILVEQFDIAEALIEGGYDLRREPYLITNENVPDPLVRNYTFWGWLRDIVTNALPLVEICRNRIRCILGRDVTSHVYELPIPIKIQDYLSLAHLLPKQENI